MYQIIFRNYNTSEIETLLMEIGPYRFTNALKNSQLPKPKQMKNFFLECNVDCTFLVYKYPEGIRKIMKIDDYKLPEHGWRLLKVNR